jgi:membrane protein implicated in regulation of membrane protease activity
MMLFAWYNLLFYIPLGIGLLMVLGVVLGITEMPHGIDVDGDHDFSPGNDASPDHDTDHGAEHGATHEHNGGSRVFFSLIGFGKAPVLILVMAMTLIFGGTGTIVNFFIAPLLRFTGAFVVISIAAALFTMVSLTGIIARTVARFMPTLETESCTKHDLVGCGGSIVLDSDTASGLVQISKKGDVYQVSCRSSEVLTKGTSVLVTDYDATQKVYVVCRHPAS